MSRIVVVGSLDSKANPFAALVAQLQDRGEQPVVIDTSVFPSKAKATYPAAVVAGRAGRDHATLAGLGRADAVASMSRGAADILVELHGRSQVGALVCMGGSNASAVFASLAPLLPLGIPKILMATSVAGDTRPIVGGNDVVLLYPVVDVDGDNPLLARMIERLAATAVALKSTATLSGVARRRPFVALSMYGVTTPCVQQAARALDDIGFEPLVFHANGTGGRSVEAFVREGIVAAVIDATLAELGNELLGGAFPAGADRLTAAAALGVPQVIAPGAIDMIAFGPRDTVPERFSGHKILAHNELVTLVRTTQGECRAIGERLAQRLGRPAGAVVVCIPLGGTSMLDRHGGPFHDPQSVHAFRDGFVAAADPRIEVRESRHNINDAEFAELLVLELRRIVVPPPE